MNFKNDLDYLIFLGRKVIPALEKCKYHASYSVFREELRDKRFVHLRKGIVFWNSGRGWRLHKDARSKLNEKMKSYSSDLRPKLMLEDYCDDKEECPGCGETFSIFDLHPIPDHKNPPKYLMVCIDCIPKYV